MHISSFSSGDPIADRRIAYAEMLAESGDFAAAAELVEQALELAGDWLPGLELLGRYREAQGEAAAAIPVWTRMARLDAEDRFGAVLKLAAHGVVTQPVGPALGYVEALFDAYADEFEQALVQRLDYAAPALLEDAIAAMGVDGFAHGLDLGCGTGLMGERLRGQVSYLVGIDLSEAMVALAARKGIYDRTEKAELIEFLSRQTSRADLVTAADVLAYFGDLAPFFAAVTRVVAPGGLLAFTLEAHDGPEPCVLRASLRYAHSEAGVRELAMAHGFDAVSISRAPIRNDRGAPIIGLIAVCRKSDAHATDLPDADAGLFMTTAQR